MNNDLTSSAALVPWTAVGEHRFIPVQGRTGWQALSLASRLELATTAHAAPQGTLILEVAALEDLSTVPEMHHILEKDRHAYAIPLITDNLPGRNWSNATFGIFFNQAWYPKLLAKFTYGTLFPQMDFVRVPIAYAESLRFRRRSWYQITLTWDRPASRIRLYVNGRLAGTMTEAVHFPAVKERLYVGNPTLVVGRIALDDRAWTHQEITADAAAIVATETAEVRTDLDRAMSCLPQTDLPPLPGSGWNQALHLGLRDAADLDHFQRQGPEFQDLPECRTTPEGLLIRTPEAISTDTRTYLWSRASFEGDLAVSFQARPESARGLALLVVHASGMHREDFITDHGLPKTGAMQTIIEDRVRNYHWEWFRRVEHMREDTEPQLVCKNPWQRPLDYRLIPRLECGRWHQVELRVIAGRLTAAIDGQVVFDHQDTAWDGHGTAYDTGRIALRQMYHTAIRYRDLVVMVRNPVT